VLRAARASASWPARAEATPRPLRRRTGILARTATREMKGVALEAREREKKRRRGGTRD